MKKDWPWQNLGDASPEQIEMWAKVFTDAVNTGLLTKFTPAFDIDVEIGAAATLIENHVRAQVDDRGRVLVRFGRRPRRAILFRANAPFRKITRSLVAPNGSKHKLEFLGDGEQLAAFGTHPDTHKLYEWVGGLPGQVPRAHLPCIDGFEAEELADQAVRLLVERFGCKLIGFAAGNGADPGPHSGTTPQADLQLLTRAAAALPNTGGWDDWNRMGMALWGGTDGSEAGFALFDEWSQRSPLYNAENTRKKWAAYFRCPPLLIGAGTVIWLADQHAPGWRGTR
jgi:hypothetical protein